MFYVHAAALLSVILIMNELKGCSGGKFKKNATKYVLVIGDAVVYDD